MHLNQDLLKKIEDAVADPFCGGHQATVLLNAYLEHTKNPNFDIRAFYEANKSNSVTHVDWRGRCRNLVVTAHNKHPLEFSDSDKSLLLGVKQVLKEMCAISPSMKYLTDRMNPSLMFISGGAIASLLQGYKPNDIDVYFMNRLTANDVVDLLKNNDDLIAECTDEYAESIDAPNNKLITDKAITCIDKFQYVTCMCGTPDEIRKSFDFLHCMPWYDIGTNKLWISMDEYLACIDKRLVLQNPAASSGKSYRYREHKFLERGYRWA